MSDEPNPIGQFMIEAAAEQVAMECVLQAMIETHPNKAALLKAFEAFRAGDSMRGLHGGDPVIGKAVQAHFDKWNEALRTAVPSVSAKVSH